MRDNHGNGEYTYKKDRVDWMMACHSCNIKMDNRKRDEKGRYICD